MTVLFRGKHIDPISLWSNYVDFPSNWTPNENDEFAPLVVCPNPDHQTSKRHFQVNLHEPLVHCFAGCGISGTWEDAIVQIEGGTHRQARKSIFRHVRTVGRVPVRKRRRRGATEDISPELLTYERFIPQAGLAYLHSRGITDEIVARYELGWDADALRVVIPVKDARGTTRLLIKRTVKPRVEPRYLYTEGVERNGLLFGLDTIDLGMVRSTGIVLVEGSFDKMVVEADGFDMPMVAILGSKVSEIHGRLISKLRPKAVYTMFDADASGISATISAAYNIRGAPIRVCRYPKGKTDPGMLTGTEAFRSVQRSVPFVKFRQQAGLASPKRNRKEITQVG